MDQMPDMDQIPDIQNMPDIQKMPSNEHNRTPLPVNGKKMTDE